MHELSNSVFRLKVDVSKDEVHVILEDKQIPLQLSNGNYIYRAHISGSKETVISLQNPKITCAGNNLTIYGKLAGIDVEHSFSVPPDKPWIEEHIVLHNSGEKMIILSEFEMGFPLQIKDKTGNIIPEIAQDHLASVPFLHRADDKDGVINDFKITDIPEQPGWEYLPDFNRTQNYTRDSPHHFSEGWAWIHENRSVGIFSFNQEHLVYSVLSPVKESQNTLLRFGGACYLPIMSQPSALTRISKGDTVDLGITRYQSVDGKYREVAYAFRAMLDEKGCRFPEKYNPPVHWEQLYDMKGAWNNRKKEFTKDRIEKEALKGVQYSCEALYLDPGWDTKFGSFTWGEEWLGPRKAFIDKMMSEYNLKVSLHTPMPPWTTVNKYPFGPSPVSEWPAESRRTPPSELLIDSIKMLPEICMGSEAFLKEAEIRLLENCKDGVVFLMFDGNGWNGECIDSTHGHPVPYLPEDHMRNNIELVKKIHSKYPNVLIELHDMLDGGSRRRMTPVYYKYGLPLSFDENWGFELMWNPMEDLKQGRGLAMYYYNLGCNIPVYLHIDLKYDNENCLVLWWFASTVRHLGIGGTHKDKNTVEAQKAAMKYYRQYDRFYKRGEFYGINEEIHIHVLPEENSFMVNIFNLSDSKRTISGKIDLEKLGLNPKLSFETSKPCVKVENGVVDVNLELQGLSTEVCRVIAMPSHKRE